MKKIFFLTFIILVSLFAVKNSAAAELPNGISQKTLKCGWIETTTSPIYNCAPTVFPDIIKIKKDRWAWDKTRLIYVYDNEGDPFTYRIEGQLPPGLKYGKCPKEGVGFVQCHILGIAKKTGKYQLEFFTKDKLDFEDQIKVTIEVVR